MAVFLIAYWINVCPKKRMKWGNEGVFLRRFFATLTIIDNRAIIIRCTFTSE